MIRPELDHVGIVVPALEPALEDLRTQLGFEFTVVFDDDLAVQEPSRGNGAIHLRIAYSAQRPALEIIEAVPETPWSPDQHGLHHLAFFVDDLDRDSRQLAGLCPIEICGLGEDGAVPTTFTYHTGGAFRLELLSPRLA
jgi:catechol 2,3-dioxygenase-like lactoylglutathione lyase family enzyme